MTTAPTFASGALFGAALTLSGVYQPSVIISQLRLTNFHMLSAFLAASATSAVIIFSATSRGLLKPSPPPPSPLGLLGPYGANILGGLLLGAGMALTGACPGTVLVQVATGVRSGRFVALGGLLGGLAHALYRRQQPPSARKTPPPTLPTVLSLSPAIILLAYEALCGAMLIASATLAPQSPPGTSLLPPELGGLLIGVAQGATVLLTARTVGVSGAYGEAGAWAWHWLLDGGGKPRPGTAALAFAAGILAGAAALAQGVALPVESFRVGAGAAVAGGAAMIVGARVAGGCTSGHGISGMATFAVSSFVTVAAMFGGGIAVALWLG